MLQYQLFRSFQAYGLRVIFHVIINDTGNVLTNISQCKFMKLSSITFNAYAYWYQYQTNKTGTSFLM